MYLSLSPFPLFFMSLSMAHNPFFLLSLSQSQFTLFSISLSLSPITDLVSVLALFFMASEKSIFVAIFLVCLSACLFFCLSVIKHGQFECGLWGWNEALLEFNLKRTFQPDIHLVIVIHETNSATLEGKNIQKELTLSNKVHHSCCIFFLWPPCPPLSKRGSQTSVPVCSSAKKVL